MFPSKEFPFKIDGVYCRLLVLTKGFHAIVDAADYGWLMQWKWCVHVTTKGIYALRRSVREDGNATTVKMHRAILNAPKGIQVDHKNGCGLHNYRKNLRFATNQQNSWNSRKQRDGRSGYKGVSWQSSHQRWRARIFVNGKEIHLGKFMTAEDAAKAYDKAAAHYRGEFCKTNFIDQEKE